MGRGWSAGGGGAGGRLGPGRGQALVLACLLMGVLALAVLSVLSVGTAVHERIGIQNAADATAYSLAARQAQAFNFYAFANRAQASHYVNAMTAQSVLSFAYFVEAFLTDLHGLTLSIDPCSGERDPFWESACGALHALPGIGPALALLNGAFEWTGRLVQSYQAALRHSGMDEELGRRVIPGLRTHSSALAALSTRVMGATLSALRGRGEVIAHAHDPTLSARVDSALGELTECGFDRAHQREANGSPLSPNLEPDRPLDPSAREEDDPTARAKRAMAQIANAARYPCSGKGPCPERFLTSRALAGLLPLSGPLAPLAGLLEGVPKWGQTRLLSHGFGRGVDAPEGGNLLREPVDAPHAPLSMLAQGDAIGSDDPYALSLGPSELLAGLKNPFSCGVNDDPRHCWGDPRHGKRPDRPHRYLMKTSIWAHGSEPGLRPGGLHWRVAYGDGYPAGPGWRAPNAPGEAGERGLDVVHKSIAPGISVAVFVANVRPVQDGNHPWPGLAPFPHFEPGELGAGCGGAGAGRASLDRAASRRAEFNQPSVWTRLGKSPEALLRRGPVGAGWLPRRLSSSGARPHPGSSGGPGDEANGGGVGPLGWPEGLNALARAQVYYHRPGNWAEQPNFFNPYWRPRLASIWQGREGNAEVARWVATLPDGLGAVPQRVLTH